MREIRAYIEHEIHTAYSMLDSVRETRSKLTTEADKRVSRSHEAQWLAVIHTLQGVQDHINSLNHVS